jgi:hypothetical protein
MKTVLLNGTNCTFDPINNQIDFANTANFQPGRLYAVINITTGKLIYSAASEDLGFGGSFSGDVLTYDSSNAGQSISDDLMIIYDDPSAVQEIAGSVTIDQFPPVPLDITVPGAVDVLGSLVTATRNNQIEIEFDTAPGVDLITNTFTGSGSATVANGHTIYQTGATASSSAKGVSVQQTTYRPHHETYCAFTAAFLNGTANSQQRIGLFDANNGFFIGFNGTAFGVTVRNGGSDTFTTRLSLNGDPLDGSGGSKFTRRGNPEPIDFTLSNLFRIRFAWLGSANIFFEVLSPDAEWVTFHNIRQPNTNYNPSIADPNLPMTIEITKSSGADNVSIASACWAGGTTSTLSRITDAITDRTLATTTRGVIVGKTTGGGGGYVPVKVTPSGALTVETTTDQLPPALGAQATANSVAVNIASDQIVPVTLPDLNVIGAATTTLGNNLLNAVAGTGSIDTSGYRTAYVQVISTASTGTIVFETSQDNVNFQNMNGVRQDRNDGFVTSGNIALSSSNFIYAVPLIGRYFRLRISGAISAGSVQAFVRYTQSQHAMVALPVTQLDPGNLAVQVTSATVRPVSPATTNDITSGALTGSATTAGITPISTILHLQYSVSAVSGSGSLDVVVEESLDGGTNWNAIYSFPRITGTGVFWSPLLKLRGRSYRYVQTLAGFSSVTRAAVRIMRSEPSPIVASVIDRTIVPNTLNSTSASVFIPNLRILNLMVRCTAQSTAATIALQFSDDNSNWWTSGVTLTTVNGMAQAQTTNQQWQYARAIVTAAGSGITLGELVIKGAEA